MYNKRRCFQWGPSKVIIKSVRQQYIYEKIYKINSLHINYVVFHALLIFLVHAIFSAYNWKKIVMGIKFKLKSTLLRCGGINSSRSFKDVSE
jgi:hypothetical protein